MVPMGRDFTEELPAIVVQRANTLGQQGQQWLGELNAFVADISKRWQLKLGTVLSGGSESLVINVITADQSQAILKLGLPGSANMAVETKVYDLAAGTGYAELLAKDLPCHAILLERLGDSIESQGLSVSRQIEIMCRTLSVAWLPISESYGFMTGAEKAHWLLNFIQDRWRRLEEPCDERTLNLALTYAESRQHAHRSDNAVLVHGDAHGNNTLMVLADDSSTVPCYKFVDPDGLFAEKACDLSVMMRGWSDELLDADPHKGLKARGEKIADLTGVDRTAIWQWGFVERISTGFTLLEIGMKEEGRKMLAVADDVSKRC
jgi:streptomycin 6-kinase